MATVRDVKALADAIYAEARGESRRGQRAVAHTILNRATIARRAVADVTYARGQISGLMPGDPNREALASVSPSDPDYANALEVARDVLDGKSVDPTGGATFYHADSVSPSWAKTYDATTTIGGHTFYSAPPREVRAVASKSTVAPVPRGPEFDAAIEAAIGSTPGDDFADLADLAEPAPMAGRAFTDYARQTTDLGAFDEGQLSPAAQGVVRSIRDESGVPSLQVTSGFRSPTKNAAVGGAKGSQHIQGNAVDISLRGLTEAQKAAVLDTAAKAGARGVGIYNGGTTLHVDTRPDAAFWGPNRAAPYSGAPISSAPDWAEATLQDIQAGTAFQAPTPPEKPTADFSDIAIAIGPTTAREQTAQLSDFSPVGTAAAAEAPVATPDAPTASRAAGMAAERSVPAPQADPAARVDDAFTSFDQGPSLSSYAMQAFPTDTPAGAAPMPSPAPAAPEPLQRAPMPAPRQVDTTPIEVSAPQVDMVNQAVPGVRQGLAVPTPPERPDETSVGNILGGLMGGAVIGGPLGMKAGSWLGDKLAPTPLRQIAEQFIQEPADMGKAVEAGWSSPDGSLKSFDTAKYWRELGKRGLVSADPFTTARQMAREQAQRSAAGQKTWADAFSLGNIFGSSPAVGPNGAVPNAFGSIIDSLFGGGGAPAFGGDAGAYGVALGPSGPVMTSGNGYGDRGGVSDRDTGTAGGLY